MKYFKGDEIEAKFESAGATKLSAISTQMDSLFSGAYTCYELGDVLYDSRRAPLANSINATIFREIFASLFEAFLVSGSFESYLTVFAAVFGPSVDVEFTVPGPGLLNIDISSTEADLYNFVARHIVSEAYVYDNVVDYSGDKILFQVVKGFQTQYEVEQMLFEMVPAGVYTTITLSIEV